MKTLIENIPAYDLDKYIGDNSNSYYIVDVRSKDIFDKSHINNAMNIPYEEMKLNLKIIPRNKKIIVYCDRGATSMLAARYLSERGYEVINVVGGLRNYKGKHIKNEKRNMTI